MLLTVFSVQLLLSTKIATSQTVDPYYPTGYNLLGATAYASGALGDLHSDNGVYMAFRSYASQTSAQTLYAHQETTMIAGTNYYLLKLESADTSGTNLSASMASTGRQLWGRFVYPLTGITSIPASTWTFYYRTWYSGVSEEVFTNSPSSVPAGGWRNPYDAYSSDDAYAYTSTNGETQQYGNYGFNIPPSASITKVEVGYEAYTASDEKIGITLSWNSGTDWAPPYISTKLGTSDPDTVTWIDFTDATNWTAEKLSDANFRTQSIGIQTGAAMFDVFLDWIPARVTYIASPSAHADVDILIRKSDGTIRQTRAADVANSANLTTTAQTVSGTCSWPAYTVVNETDYLEMDYYLDVTTANPDATAYLRIDDNTLPTANQTRTTGIMLPSEYTMEVEFTGSSNTDYWSQLVWTVDSAWTTGSVSVTLQLYDYVLGNYPTSGDGYIMYTSSATSNTDETKTQTITTNPTNFRDAVGNWKMKIKGLKSTTSQFGFKADLIKYEVTSGAPDVAVLNVTRSPTSVYPGEIVTINVTVKNEGGTTETFNVTTCYNNTQIGKQTVSNLAPDVNTTLTFNWNTTEVSPGMYTIKAIADTVPDETDTADNTYIDDTVKVKKHPVASFTYCPEFPIVGESVNFNASLSTPDGGVIVRYAWDFENDSMIDAYGMIVNYTYTTPGTYIVTLNVTDSEGLWDSESKSIRVLALPHATFTFSPETPLVNEKITFNASLSYDPDGEIVSYEWNFRDGNITTTSNSVITHVYFESGERNVTLTVIDNHGYSDSTSQVIAVHIRDVAILNVIVSHTDVHIGQVVNITVTAKNEGTTTESFNVTVFRNETLIGTQLVSNLAPDTEKILDFYWDTSDIADAANFLIQAKADVVSGESDVADNTYVGDIVKVSKVHPSPFSSDWNWILLIVIPPILLFAGGILWKKRRVSQKFRDFGFFDEITDGGIPDSFSVLITGGPGSGKSMLCQQLTYTFLMREKSCIYITYDCFPNELRENMKKFQWDISAYENERFLFIDSFSAIAKVASKEKYSVSQPFSLSDFGITMSKVMSEMSDAPRVFLDSMVPLLTHVDPSKVVEFLQNRSARIKGINGAFIFTVGKGTIEPNLLSRLEEAVDCVIELDVSKSQGKTIRRLRIKKMRGRKASDKWIQFEIDPAEGIIFLV